MFKLVAFAENKQEVIEELKNNQILKDKIYLLHSNENWKLGTDGLLYLNIEHNLLASYKDVPDNCSIIDKSIDIQINTIKHLQTKCKCYVDYLPDERAIQYLKMIAQKTNSIIGIGMEHERGDVLYDLYCWIFDYRKQGINNKPVNEYIYACYEGEHQYDYFYLEGCPAKVIKKWEGSGTMQAFEKLNEAFDIQSFPYWVDLRKYDLLPYQVL